MLPPQALGQDPSRCFRFWGRGSPWLWLCPSGFSLWSHDPSFMCLRVSLFLPFAGISITGLGAHANPGQSHPEILTLITCVNTLIPKTHNLRLKWTCLFRGDSARGQGRARQADGAERTRGESWVTVRRSGERGQATALGWAERDGCPGSPGVPVLHAHHMLGMCKGCRPCSDPSAWTGLAISPRGPCSLNAEAYPQGLMQGLAAQRILGVESHSFNPSPSLF